VPFGHGAFTKRMCRYNKPTGKGLQDLEKAKNEIDLIIEIEMWGRPKSSALMETEKNRIIDNMRKEMYDICSKESFPMP